MCLEQILLNDYLSWYNPLDSLSFNDTSSSENCIEIVIVTTDTERGQDENKNNISTLTVVWVGIFLQPRMSAIFGTFSRNIG